MCPHCGGVLSSWTSQEMFICCSECKRVSFLAEWEEASAVETELQETV